MRLTQQEINHLVKVLTILIGNQDAQLRLFGSRVDNQRKGGDIDLLLLTKDHTMKVQLQAKKHHILADMKELIGDQKIDLKIATHNEIKEDSFLQLIYPDSICLFQWSCQ